MKEIIIEDSKQNINIKGIDNIEGKIGSKLPIDYKAFLIKNNGGVPIKDHFNINNDNSDTFEGSILSCFYCIDSSSRYSNLETEIIFRKNRINNGLIPIADDVYGNLVCISIDSITYGKIYFWDHENEAAIYGYETPWEDNIYLIANSFTDFINSLYKFDVEEDEDGEEVYVSTHDRYSLPFSTEAKKYGKLVLDFFAQAPSDVEDFIIEQYPGDDEIKLIYNDGKKHERVIYSDGEFEDIE